MAPRAFVLALVVLASLCTALPGVMAVRSLGLEVSGLEVVQNMNYLKPITNAPERIAGAVPEPSIDAGMRRRLLQSGPLVDDLTVPRSFQHGVASGDPTPNQVIIWTRVTPVATDRRALVYFRVTTDSSLNNIVTQGAVATDNGVDWTVKVDVTGLSPEMTYYFQFTSGSAKSAIGRTRTLPTGDVSKSRIAFLTCSQYPSGYFNAYGHLATQPDIQAVLHLGDYFYEYAARPAESTMFNPPRKVQDFQTVTLDQYRARHALYKTDSDLQEAHRVHPWVIVWDDHDSANNAWRNGAQNHKTATQGPWQDRLQASVRAWYEWQPVRQVQFDLKLRIYRSFQIGTLLDLIMIDTRIIGRDRQTDDPPDPPVLNYTTGNDNWAALFDRERTMLGAQQLSWLQGQLSDSKGRGAVWRMIGNQVLFTQMPATLQEQDPLFNGFIGPVTGYSDGWDAYPETRFQVLDHIRRNAIDNVVVVTGDTHATVVSDIPFYPYQSWGRSYIGNPQNTVNGDLGVNANFTRGTGSMAVEVGVTSVTSSFYGEDDAARAKADVTDARIKSLMPHLKYSRYFGHGYVITEFTKTQATHTFCFVNTILQRDLTTDCSKVLKQMSGTNHLIDA